MQHISHHDLSGCIVSSTVELTSEMRSDIQATDIPRIVYLDYTTPIPIRNCYETPQTLGMDRLAAVIGAYDETKELTGRHTPALVIDAGTAITYDFIDARGNYRGGNISPGIEMRFKALHHYTSRLPLIAAEGKHPAIGNTTETAIRCGVMEGIRHEIEGFIRDFSVKHSNLLIFLTGGDRIEFDEQIKSRIFADKFLVAKGLNSILTHLKA